MKSRMLRLCLIIGACMPFMASADQVISDNIIVSGISDGTAPAYDCSAGATLPFNLVSGFDSSSVTETIPEGDPVIRLILGACVFLPDSEPWECEYTCLTDIASAACIGQDCVNDESFAEGETLKLKENNLRIRFDNTTIDPAELGRSWNVQANSSRNNGTSNFDFQLKSLEADTVHIVTAKDGVVPSYDCTLLTLHRSYSDILFDDIKDGIIPVGQPLIYPKYIEPLSCTADPGAPLMCEVECLEVMDFEEKSLLILGPAGPGPLLADGVAVGYESSMESGVVSVGRADLVRRIAHVAAAIGATDALTLGNFDVLHQQLTNANAQLDAIEADLVIFEALAEIDDLLDDPGVPHKAKKSLKKAKKSLEKAWGKLKKGDLKKAFKEIAKTVKELLKAEKDGADVSDLINLLVEYAQAKAIDAIDAAIVAGGKPKEIEKAEQELVKAQQELDKGKPDKAIDHYAHAVDKAEKAVKK